MRENGGIWLDDESNAIQAHGGGMLHHGGKWYWYGENKSAPTYRQGEIDRADVVGISCYSSTNLLTWHHEGIVLPAVADDPNHDLHPSKVAERPKVVYNKKTKRFVMWLHTDLWNYLGGHAAVAVADSPTGPFEYLGSGRPLGHISHDMTLFVDPSDTAWLIHSADFHQALHFVRLSDDYTEALEVGMVDFVGARREAAAPFYHDGKFYMLTSGCTGWEPNACDLAVADRIDGRWRMLGDPCRGGIDPHLTWRCQSTYVIPTQQPGRFIAMFDRWNPRNLGDSRYIWLPFECDEEKTIIEWADRFEA